MTTERKHFRVKQLQTSSLTPRIQRRSMLGPLTKTPSVHRPGPFPWDEDRISSVPREHFKALSQLHHENANLKTDLRDLSSRLDAIIAELRIRKEAKPYHLPKNTAGEELKLALAQVANYEKEHARLTARLSQLSDPAFEIKVVTELEQQKERVKTLELEISHREKVKSVRDKVLESVLATGETPEMAKDIEYAITEIHVFTSQGKTLEREIAQMKPHIEKLAQREKELIVESSKLTAAIGDTPQEDKEVEQLKSRLEEAKRDVQIGEKVHLFAIGRLKSRVKSLRAELSEVTSQHQKMQEVLTQKAERSRQVAEEIRSLTPLIGTTQRTRHALQRRSNSRGDRGDYSSLTFVTQDYL